MSVTWGLGMEHEFLPATFGNGLWEAMPVGDMVAMYGAMQGRKRKSKDADAVARDDFLKTNDSVIIRIVQPATNPKPRIKQSARRLGVANAKRDVTIVQAPGGRAVWMLPVPGRAPDVSALVGVKVSVVCMVRSWNLVTYVFPDAKGAVYDFSRLQSDIDVVTRHLWKEPASSPRLSGDDAKMPFSLDSGFIEVSSKKFKDACVRSIAEEIRRFEGIVMKACEPYLAAPTILPYSMPLSVAGSKDVEEVPNYAGSYHVWVTLPHATGKKFDHRAFVADHRRASVALQWMEPLLLGCMVGDPRAAGEGHRYSRASMRHVLNSLSGLGVAMIPPVESHVVIAFASLDHLNRGDPPVAICVDAIWEKTQGGETINILACACQGRGLRGEGEWWHRLLPTAVQNHGTDIRFDTCDNVELGGDSYRYDEVKSNRAVVMVKNKAWLAVREGDGPFKLRTGSRLKPAGFEFRMFDHFPSKHAEDLLKTVVTLAALAYHPGASSLGVPVELTKRQEWIQQVSNASLYGSRGPVDKRYWTGMRAALGLPRRRVPTDIYTALNTTLVDAFECMATSSVLKRFGVDASATFPDTNFAVWQNALRARKVDAKVKKLRAAKTVDFETVRATMGAGWVLDTYALRAALKA